MSKKVGEKWKSPTTGEMGKQDYSGRPSVADLPSAASNPSMPDGPQQPGLPAPGSNQQDQG